jgi:hypothetical protein
MSWKMEVSSLTDLALSAPTWYARRTIVADSAALMVEDKKYNFRSLSVQFEQGDTLMVIAFGEDGKLAVTGTPFDIVKREGFEYTFNEALPAGKLMLIKMFKYVDETHQLHANELGDKGYYLIPVTREMVDKSKEETKAFRMVGIVSPGWYRWRQIKNAEGKVVHTSAQLAVSMKSYTNEKAGHEGQFLVQQGVMRFDPIKGTDEGGIELV